jgi:hypothetical protein
MNQIEVSFGTPLVVIHQQAGQPPVAMITFTIGEFVFKGVSIMPAAGQAVSTYSSATMPVGSMATCSVEWKDAAGNPVKVDGPTTWISTEPTIVQVTGGSSNPLITNIYAPGPLGTAQVQASADADMGEGVRKVTAVLDVTVIMGEAVSGEIKFTPTGSHPPSPGGPSAAQPRR